jgi:hypothetical protein
MAMCRFPEGGVAKGEYVRAQLSTRVRLPTNSLAGSRRAFRIAMFDSLCPSGSKFVVQPPKEKERIHP